MRLREWPARRIGVLWLGAALAEAALVLTLSILSTANKQPEPELFRHLSAVDHSVARGLVPAPNPLDIARARELIRDSLGLAVVRRGGSDAVVSTNARGDSIVKLFDQGVAVLQLIDRDVAIFLAAVFLPIPMVALAMTMWWGWAKCRQGSMAAPPGVR